MEQEAIDNTTQILPGKSLRRRTLVLRKLGYIKTAKYEAHANRKKIVEATARAELMLNRNFCFVFVSPFFYG